MFPLSTKPYRRLRAIGGSLYRRVRSRVSPNEDHLAYQCNICGTHNCQPRSELTRESRSCHHCGSSVRLRGIVHLLSDALFGESHAVRDFPVAKNLKGFGLSDWEVYAVGLAEKLDYTNTYYHQEPRLDICDVDSSTFGTLDFLISTDVFEHVPPPVSVAFKNAFQLLKPGGVMIFSVPYNTNVRTVEHFPELNDFRLEQREDGYVLHNRTEAEEEQIFENLVFHGGAGSTLEMRVFGDIDLRQHFLDAGFEEPTVFSESYEPFGILWPEKWSLPWVARRPLSS